MKVDTLHIIGVSKNGEDKEVEDSTKNIAKRYEKNGGMSIIVSHLSLANVETFGGMNKKATKMGPKLEVEVITAPTNNVVVANPARVGVYVVFHGGTAEPIDFKGLAKVVLMVMANYPGGALQKVVLMACYLAATLRVPADAIPLNNFCTTLFLEASPAQRKLLPMIAGWKCDVYTGNKSGATGHTQVKEADKYVRVTDRKRNDSKVIAVRTDDKYVLKDYGDAAEDWHDGAVENKDGVVAHVRG